jgi:hypothetical protein
MSGELLVLKPEFEGLSNVILKLTLMGFLDTPAVPCGEILQKALSNIMNLLVIAAHSSQNNSPYCFIDHTASFCERI